MKPYLLFAAVAGATGVALGALGAHGLKATLAERGTQHAWETAVLYQMVHAIALLSTCAYTAIAAKNSPTATWINRACISWGAGIVLFSGSIYLLSLGGPRWIGPITPVGGLALLAGWIFLGIGALKHSLAANENPTR